MSGFGEGSRNYDDGNLRPARAALRCRDGRFLHRSGAYPGHPRAASRPGRDPARRRLRDRGHHRATLTRLPGQWPGHSTWHAGSGSCEAPRGRAAVPRRYDQLHAQHQIRRHRLRVSGRQSPAQPLGVAELFRLRLPAPQSRRHARVRYRHRRVPHDDGEYPEGSGAIRRQLPADNGQHDRRCSVQVAYRGIRTAARRKIRAAHPGRRDAIVPRRSG